MLDFLFLFVSLLVAVSVHEFSHAWVADRLGDPTPRVQGRLTLNPLAHLDIAGTLMLLLFHFGWGKPVVVNSQYFRVPLRDNALVSLAGPVSNFVVAFVLSVVMLLVQDGVPEVVFSLLGFMLDLNIILGVFNLLPFPPFDGSKILGLFMPVKWGRAYERYLERGTVYVILFVLFDFIVLKNAFGYSIIQVVVSVLAAFVKGVLVLGV